MTAVTIDQCGRTIAASIIAFDIQWSGDLPGDREITWAVRISSAAADGEVELGHRRSAGGPSQYARDLSTGRTQEVTPDADVSAREITVRFASAVVGQAVEWPIWKAVLTVDDEDVAVLAVTP